MSTRKAGEEILQRKKRINLICLICCIMLVSQGIQASKIYFTYSFENSGKKFSKMSNVSSLKQRESDAWTIAIDEISVTGDNGMLFCPVIFNQTGNKVLKICSESGVWISSTSAPRFVEYAPGDGEKGIYRVAARMDDLEQGTFHAAGWFHPDECCGE